MEVRAPAIACRSHAAFGTVPKEPRNSIRGLELTSQVLSIKLSVLSCRSFRTSAKWVLLRWPAFKRHFFLPALYSTPLHWSLSSLQRGAFVKFMQWRVWASQAAKQASSVLTFVNLSMVKARGGGAPASAASAAVAGSPRFPGTRVLS